MDLKTEQSTRLFLSRVNRRFNTNGAILFGSHARRDARNDSDADLAVLIEGTRGHRLDVALDMAEMAFDVMLATGVLIDALPLSEDEWLHPETFDNPAFHFERPLLGFFVGRGAPGKKTEYEKQRHEVQSSSES